MTKVIISKTKRDKIESILFAGAGALVMIYIRENNNCTDKVIKVRDLFMKDILDILDNKSP